MYPPKELTTKLNDKIIKLYMNDSSLNEKEKKLLNIVKDAIRKKISSIKKKLEKKYVIDKILEFNFKDFFI